MVLVTRCQCNTIWFLLRLEVGLLCCFASVEKGCRSWGLARDCLLAPELDTGSLVVDFISHHNRVTAWPNSDYWSSITDFLIVLDYSFILLLFGSGPATPCIRLPSPVLCPPPVNLTASSPCPPPQRNSHLNHATFHLLVFTEPPRFFTC